MTFPAKLGLLLMSALSVRGQAIVSVQAGLINYCTGNVTLDGERLRPGSQLHQMRSGQTLSTGKGRVEVLLAPEIILRLGEVSSIRIEDTRLEDTRVVLDKGSAFIEVLEIEKEARLRVLLADSEIEFKRTGLYRLDAAPVRLQVYGGEAGVLRTGVTTLPVLAKRGQAVDLRALELAEFDFKTADALHTWSAQRSFALYNSSIETRNKQKHWEYLGDGWVFNRNYRVKFRSMQARRENSWADQQLRRGPSIPRADSRE